LISTYSPNSFRNFNPAQRTLPSALPVLTVNLPSYELRVLVD
jgi:hypothetical protein